MSQINRSCLEAYVLAHYARRTSTESDRQTRERPLLGWFKEKLSIIIQAVKYAKMGRICRLIFV